MLIRLVSKNHSTIARAEEGIDLMTFLRDQGHIVQAPCGGRGTCGKCLVEIDGVGPVLACQTRIGSDVTVPLSKENPDDPDLTVRLPSQEKALILIDGLMKQPALNPLVHRQEVLVKSPTLADQRADDDRFYDASGYRVPFALLAELPAILAEQGGRVCFIGRNDTKTVVRFVPLDTSLPPAGENILPGVAVDIGTTTLAAYLYDLNSGQRLASTAMVNPQTGFGADVISRIAKASLSAADQAELQAAILQAITKFCVQLLNQAEDASGQIHRLQDIVQITVAGNTTMMHLLTGLPPLNISMSPFNPVTTRAWILSAADLNMTAFPHAICTLLPSVASYVGADITAGILALGLEQPQHESALLIDIGTNGEIALRAGDRLTACATAAGPAFEGANISSGLSGVAGAIDHVWMNGDDLCYSVISKESVPISKCDIAASANMEKPIGICGSGLIDAVAVMLETGVIDETGRIGTDEPALSELMRQRLTTVDNQPAFILAFPSETGRGQPIQLTQKDIRELQNAKAAIAAGIQLLLQLEGVEPASIKTIYLAGGFGQYLNIRSARSIGLLPADLGGHVVSAGNTAAMGAISVLLDAARLAKCQRIADTVVYRELSSNPLFTDFFIEALIFPEAGA